MNETKSYRVEVSEMVEYEQGAVESRSGPMVLESAFYRRRRAIRELAEAERLHTHTAQIVDERGGRF
jgi:hypothetical protein